MIRITGVLPAIQARYGGAAAQGEAQQGPERPQEAAVALLSLLSRREAEGEGAVPQLLRHGGGERGGQEVGGDRPRVEAGVPAAVPGCVPELQAHDGG